VGTEVRIVTRIVLNVKDERKASILLSLFNDLDYVDAQAETFEKVWEGDLPVRVVLTRLYSQTMRTTT